MRTITLAWATVLAMLVANRADAAYTVAFTQIGNDVLASGVGTLVTSALTYLGPGIANTPNIGPADGLMVTGAGTTNGNSPSIMYLAFFSPTSGFGSGSVADGTSGTGDIVGIEPSAFFLIVPVGYVSGDRLASTTTFANTTLSSFGLFEGSTVYSYSATRGGPTVDMFTVRTEYFPGASIPEPASLVMLGVGLMGAVIAARRPPAWLFGATTSR